MINHPYHRSSKSSENALPNHMHKYSEGQTKILSPQKTIGTTSIISHVRAKSEIETSKSKPITKITPMRQKNYLDSTMWYREIFIIRDGISNPDELLEGFKYKFIHNGIIKRQNQQQELQSLFDLCNKRWKSVQKFISIFTIDGKILKSFAELSSNSKVAVVGASFIFCGMKIQKMSEKEIFEFIEERFVKKNTEVFVTSLKKKPVLEDLEGGKSFLLKFRAKSSVNKVMKTEGKNAVVNRYKFMSFVKERLGETSAKLDRSLPKLQHKTLKKLMEKYELSESDLHKIYAQYKTLLIMSVAQNPNHDFRNGIINDTLIQCLRKGEVKEEGLIEKLISTIDIDRKGCLSWEEFLKAMSVIHFGSLSQQIDMLFRMYDTDLSGSLSFPEIQELCKRQLKTSKDDTIAMYLAESFAKIIFSLACVPITETLSPEELKRVLQNKDQQSIIRMFCNFQN